MAAVHDDRRRRLAFLLPAGISPGLDRTHEALLEFLGFAREVRIRHCLDDVFADQHVAGGDVARTDDFAGPRAGLAAGAHSSVAVEVEDRELAELEVRVAFAQVLQHLVRRHCSSA